jgi:Stress responsive A/B Barrel Domain
VITHIVMFRWSRALTDAERDAVHQAFEALRGIPEVAHLRHGPDLGRRPGNADYVVVVTAQDWDGFLRYLKHPDHLRLVDVTSGFTEARWSVQSDFPTR